MERTERSNTTFKRRTERLLQYVLRLLSAVADRVEAVGGWSFRERYSRSGSLAQKESKSLLEMEEASMAEGWLKMLRWVSFGQLKASEMREAPLSVRRFASDGQSSARPAKPSLR